MHNLALGNHGKSNVKHSIRKMSVLLTCGLSLALLVFSLSSLRAVPQINELNLPSNATKTFPDAIVFGIRKCGTRAVLEFLRVHPDVVVALNEVHYFDRNLDKGLDWYINQMSYKVKASQITIEKTPAYFITPRAPEVLSKLKRNIKLILIVKDPITRAISDYAQVNARRQSLNGTVYKFEDLVFTPDGKSINRNYKPIWISIYHIHILHWLKYFTLDDIHIIDGEEFIREPYKELYKVEDFLGIKHYLSEDKFYFNKTKGFYCAKDMGKEICMGETKGRRHPEVQQVVIDKLVEFYRPHNALFFNMIRRKFPWMGMK